VFAVLVDTIEFTALLAAFDAEVDGGAIAVLAAKGALLAVRLETCETSELRSAVFCQTM
jgi:hypothetical protein